MCGIGESARYWMSIEVVAWGCACTVLAGIFCTTLSALFFWSALMDLS